MDPIDEWRDLLLALDRHEITLDPEFRKELERLSRIPFQVRLADTVHDR